MESVYHIVTIRVNEISWAHVWRLRSLYLRTGYDMLYKGWICVPNVKELKEKILREAHESAYSIHSRGNKMYHYLKATYWWYGMKRDVVEYVALYDISQ
jgi:hypothetical protein